jgi:hypothetical protein
MPVVPEPLKVPAKNRRISQTAQRIIFRSDGPPSLAGGFNEHHGRNARMSAAENRQEMASNVQPGLALPAVI